MPKPLVIGHRGMGVYGKGSTHAENSIKGFRAALSAGADGIELDVQLSADAEAIVHHDSKLGRVTSVDNVGGKCSVAQLDSREISKLRLLGGRGETVSTLTQVLEELRGELEGRELWIELKAQRETEKGRKLVERVVETLSKNRLWQQTLILSFDHRLLTITQELAPDLRLLLIAMLRVRRSIQVASEKRFEAVGIYHRLAVGTTLRMARSSKLSIATGILDSESQIRRFANLEVDYLVTDLPALAASLSAGPGQCD